MANVNFNKHVWEGWTVGNFIEELEPILDMVQQGGSWDKPKRTKAEIKKWCMDNQPYYKKHIPEVVTYFCARYRITK